MKRPIRRNKWNKRKEKGWAECECDDSIRDANILDGLDLNEVLGQQLVMWSYKEPDSLNLYTPVIGDNLSTLLRLTTETLHFDRKIHKLMILKAGTNHPIDISQFHCVEPGSAIMIMPRYNITVNIDIKQLHMQFQTEVDLSMTVYQFKHLLQQEKGLAQDRLDCLFKDQPMENRQYLFNYRIGKKSTIFVMTHIHYDILVHVDTFWGTTYHLYLDPCMTGLNVIWMVLRRTVTKNTTDIMAMFELYLPKHSLVLYHRQKVVNWHTCLGYYNIDDNDTVKLSTIGLYHKLSLQKMPVCDDSGKMQTVKVSKYDRWATVALKMHGVLGVSVNLIRIYYGNKEVDFSETIGKYNFKSPAVHVNLSLSKADPDVLYGISLNFHLGGDVTEIVKVSSKRTVKSVKHILEQLGVPNAAVHDMYIGDYKLSSHEKLVNAIEDMGVQINLKLMQYPVFIHTNSNVIYRMNVYAQESVAAFHKRIEMKSGLSLASHKLLLAGDEFKPGNELTVFETRLGIRSSLFMIPRLIHDTFFVLYDDYMLKVKIPQKPKSHQLKQLLWEEMTLPSGALASVGVFLQWYYTGRSRPVVARTRRPEGYYLQDPAHNLLPGQLEDYKELQADQLNRNRRRDFDRLTYPFKPVAKESNPAMKVFYEKERQYDKLKARSFSYPAQLFPSYESFKDRSRPEKFAAFRSDCNFRGKTKRSDKVHLHEWHSSYDRNRDKRLMSLQEDQKHKRR